MADGDTTDVTADKPATTKKSAPSAPSTPTEHNSAINAALDSAAKAMVASGMSEAQAEAFLNSARPSGVSTVVGNLADLHRSTGLPDIAVETTPTINDDRLAFATKVEGDSAPPAPKSTF